MIKEDFIQKYCFAPAGDDAYIDSSAVFRKDLDELLKQEIIEAVRPLLLAMDKDNEELLKQEAIGFDRWRIRNDWELDIYSVNGLYKSHSDVVTIDELYQLYKDNQHV